MRLRGRLALLFLFAAFVPFTALFVVVQTSLIEELHEEHARQLQTRVASAQRRLSELLERDQRAVRALCDHDLVVDRLAQRIGAVNTVYRRAGKLWGTNTDAIGVTAPLEKRTPLKKATVLIAGNGGAARGAIFATKATGARVTLTGRNPRRVRALARACGVEAIEREKLTDRHFDILIHTTPLGMSPNVDNCFFSDDIPADLVFDMVYNPLETLLLKKARLAGKQTISGLEMFLEQAAAQFEIWTGETAPRTVMKKTVLQALGAA